MTPIERRRRPERFQRIQYPFVVEPSGERWRILFVRTERPYTVAEFDSKIDAIETADFHNDEAYFEREAEYAAKALIEAVMDRVRAEANKQKWRDWWGFLRRTNWQR